MFKKLTVDGCIGVFTKAVEDLKTVKLRCAEEGTRLDIKAQEIMGKAEAERLEANRASRIIIKLERLFGSDNGRETNDGKK